MNFNLSNGASRIIVSNAIYGVDQSSQWSLWSSVDDGLVWLKVANVNCTKHTLYKDTIYANISGKVRFEIRHSSLNTSRINIDDLYIEDFDTTASQDYHLTLGNPSNAQTDIAFPDNYLLAKDQYILSYNSSKGIPNWVGWHMSSAWHGSAPRKDAFKADATLPTSFIRIKPSDYTNSVFDRGHMCPSEDRDLTTTDNLQTFLMTNMIPQAPNCNQQTWRYLEQYCQTTAQNGKELYIYSGGIGSGGSGSKGLFTTIANGKVVVPQFLWKVIVVLPNGPYDLNRITADTKVIAVKVPNMNFVTGINWSQYRVSVDKIESLTGLNFLADVDDSIEDVLEAQVP
ncbi:MAG: hypothetical protein A3K10_08135 [Bacteroidetes bacterium RIFCSPLOWO2_12_FULL_31_6]|nr:MAG: hypothetical protein A3K10_08135 [Bacteroidetes bacterium RIFCSPLOWO2_12_FULL_31_6]